MTFIEEKLAAFKKRCREIDEPTPPKPRYEVPEDNAPRFNVRRTTLPGGKVEVLVFNLSYAEALAWISEDRGERRKRFHENNVVSPIDGIPPVTLYEPIPCDATVDEQSIYCNPRPLITEESRPVEQKRPRYDSINDVWVD